MTRNVGSIDQAMRLALGTVFVVSGLARRRFIPAIAGLAFWYTAFTRYCPVSGALGITTDRGDTDLPATDKPAVQEASEESFPASDAPAYNH